MRQGHEDRVRGLQKELRGDMYRDAEDLHKGMLIKHRVRWREGGRERERARERERERDRERERVRVFVSIRPQSWLLKIWRSTTKF